MLRQNESEVLDAIRNDPATDTTFDFQDGDFVQIEQFENARVGIDWEILSIPYHRMRTHGSLFLDNNVVTFLVVPIEPPFPFQVVLDKLGNPELLDFIDGSDGFALLSLMYPKERVWFNVRVTGNPLTLTGESMVESVAYSSMELAQEDYCIAGYFHWGGLGDLSTLLYTKRTTKRRVVFRFFAGRMPIQLDLTAEQGVCSVVPASPHQAIGGQQRMEEETDFRVTASW